MPTVVATRWGTSHFKDFESAKLYYRDYFSGTRAQLARHVLDKINAGEIHLGPPTIKPGEKLVLVDNGTRYAITRYAVKVEA